MWIWGTGRRPCSTSEICGRPASGVPPILIKHSDFSFGELFFPIRWDYLIEMASRPPPGQGVHVILAGPVTLSPGNMILGRNKFLGMTVTQWGALKIFSLFSLCGISEMTQFLPFLRLVLQPYLPFLSYSISFQELFFFLLLQLAGSSIYGMQPKVPTWFSYPWHLPRMTGGWVFSEPKAGRHASCSLSQYVHTPCLRPSNLGEGLGRGSFVR